MDKVWFITGYSTGFGRELAKLVLASGYKAAVTSRNPNDVRDIVTQYPDTSIAIQLDVTKPVEIKYALMTGKLINLLRPDYFISCLG